MRRRGKARRVTQTELHQHEGKQGRKEAARLDPPPAGLSKKQRASKKKAKSLASKEPLIIPGEIHAWSNTGQYRSIYGVNPQRQPKRSHRAEELFHAFGCRLCQCTQQMGSRTGKGLSCSCRQMQVTPADWIC